MSIVYLCPEITTSAPSKFFIASSFSVILVLIFFSVTAKSDIDKLNEMYDKLLKDSCAENFSAFRIKVHSMKSNVATIGANHVAGLAKYLEYAARDEKVDEINHLLPLFEREWISLKKCVDEKFGYEKKENSSESIEKDKLMVYLENLAEAMSEYDYDKADSVIEEMSVYAFNDGETKNYEQLKTSVMNLDTDGCIECINEWKTLL